jgi:hypothetical protein
MQGGNSKYFKIPNSNHKKKYSKKEILNSNMEGGNSKLLKFQIPTTKRNIPKKKFQTKGKEIPNF